MLSKTRIWSHVRKYMMKEGCLGEIVVHLTEDLLSRASMTVVNGCPTLTINVSTAREHWLEGMLRHEIGTHYFRGINNLQQPWNSWTGRKKHELKPNNPTEEGLASIHSVLFRKDPFYGGLPSSTTLCIEPARCPSVNSSKILASLSRTPIQDGITVYEPREDGLILPNQGVSVKTRCTWMESFRSSDTERASTFICSLPWGRFLMKMWIA